MTGSSYKILRKLSITSEEYVEHTSKFMKITQ